MPKHIAEDKEKLKEKLEYIGLNLERVPTFLKEFTPFSFRPLKSYDNISYKVYKYVDVADIEILLTPTDRLTNLSESYKLAMPIGRYLDSKTEENLEYFTTFLSMLNNTDLEEIKEVEAEQEKLKENIPYEVKYANNYIWQIYYSDVSDKYFMLVPTNEYNNSALFYLIKKQIEAKKSRRKELIYVPISHQEYAGSFLVKSQISDLENYLWYFTKEWPEIFEVYNQKNKMQLKIVGKTRVYEKIQSDYVITLNSKEEAIEWYKLMKALFILATGLPEDYSFKTKINDNGELELSYINNNNETVIKYSNLLEFIQNEANQKKLLIGLEDKKMREEQEKINYLKEAVEKQTEDYLLKQRQIATFLECKKTFFGKVKYYFSNRKKEFQNATKYRAKEQKKVEVQKNEENSIITDLPETKQHTIEDLIEICTKLDERKKLLKNLKLDNTALELKKVNLERKIKNANIYLNEIELHKKSIFEFWKFTNKDELPSLNEGEEEQNKEKIEKIFDYELDIEDLGKAVDELQRRKLFKKIVKKGDKITIHSKLKNIRLKSKIKIVRNIIEILKREKSNKIILERNLKEDTELMNLLYSYNINICNDRQIFKKYTNEIVENILKESNKLKKESEIYLCVNNLDEFIEKIIYNFAKSFRRVNIITNHISDFKKIENNLYNENGILINITNNRKKSLLKAEIIVNFDFTKELLNQFVIYEKSIIIDLEGDVKIRKKRFCGKIINKLNLNFSRKDKIFEYIEKNKLQKYDIYDLCQALNVIPKIEE